MAPCSGEHGLDKRPVSPPIASVAQLVEQMICNHQVGGSNPSGGSLGGRNEIK